MTVMTDAMRGMPTYMAIMGVHQGANCPHDGARACPQIAAISPRKPLMFAMRFPTRLGVGWLVHEKRAWRSMEGVMEPIMAAIMEGSMALREPHDVHGQE